MRPPLALLAFTLFTTAACVIVIDDEGFSTHGFSSIHDHNGGQRIVGSGTTATEHRQIESFESLNVLGSLDLELTIVPGLANTELTVKADDNIVPRVITEVKNGQLNVSLKSGSYSYKTKVSVHVRTASIKAAQLTGSGDLTINNIDSPDFNLNLTGSGDIAINGTAQNLRIGLSGSGDIDADHLVAQNASVSLSGSGEIGVNATGKLDIELSGSGDIRHSGNAQTNSSLSGSGSISPAK